MIVDIYQWLMVPMIDESVISTPVTVDVNTSIESSVDVHRAEAYWAGLLTRDIRQKNNPM